MLAVFTFAEEQLTYRTAGVALNIRMEIALFDEIMFPRVEHDSQTLDIDLIHTVLQSRLRPGWPHQLFAIYHGIGNQPMKVVVPDSISTTEKHLREYQLRMFLQKLVVHYHLLWQKAVSFVFVC